MDLGSDRYDALLRFESGIAESDAWFDALQGTAATFLGMTTDALRIDLGSGMSLTECAARRSRSIVALKGTLLSTVLAVQGLSPCGGWGADVLLDLVEHVADAPGGIWNMETTGTIVS